MSTPIPEDVLKTAGAILADVIDCDCLRPGGIDAKAQIIARALMAEREACAKIADEFGGGDYWGAAKPIASAIRDRSKS